MQGNNMMKNKVQMVQSHQVASQQASFRHPSSPRGPHHIKLTAQASIMIASRHGNIEDSHENSTEEASI